MIPVEMGFFHRKIGLFHHEKGGFLRVKQWTARIQPWNTYSKMHDISGFIDLIHGNFGIQYGCSKMNKIEKNQHEQVRKKGSTIGILSDYTIFKYISDYLSIYLYYDILNSLNIGIFNGENS